MKAEKLNEYLGEIIYVRFYDGGTAMGHLCKYCPYTCINRTKEFRGKEKKK